MSRNRYTKTIRKEERARLARREKNLDVIAKTLDRRDTGFESPVPINKAKDRRSIRLEHKRQHKPERPGATGAGQS